jgi:thiamine-phosphate pyrophosphorylase
MANGRSSLQRLCLVTPVGIPPADLAARLEAALSGGDVASLIITLGNAAPSDLQMMAETLTPIAQRHDVAALVHNDTRIAGRARADGVHVDTGPNDLRDAVARLRPQRLVGAGGAETRHDAMVLGEADPDYVFFGRLDGDTDSDPHPQALALAAWWAPLFHIPAIVMGGASLESLGEAAATGAEFIALSRAVWDHADGPAAAIAEANSFLAATRLPT